MKKIFLGLIILMLLGGGVNYAGTYTDSAHGNTTYGVDRANPFPDYAIGNCAHCHEQHASIGGNEPAPTGGTPSGFCLLANNFDTTATTGTYNQDDNACFYCHTNTGYLQDGVITNNDYSATFGGGSTSATGIMQAFNLASYHNLNDVLNFAKGEWTSTFTDYSNPCSGCHNIHIAQRSCGKPTGSYDPTKSAISKPSDHNNLWGDDAGERMNVYTSYYQAPYWSGPTYFEPFSTNITTDGSNLPDYVSFCADCHDADNVITSTTLSGNLKFIDWATTGGESGGDKHGKNIATATSGTNINLKEPYLTVWTTSGLVLACTDCHEPHGAPNVMLIRKEVNSAALAGTITTIAQTGCSTPYPTGNKELGYLCNRCHEDDGDHYGASYANRWYWVHHASSDRPYSPSTCGSCHSSGGGSGYTSGRNPINCNCCHYHGSSAASRRTF